VLPCDGSDVAVIRHVGAVAHRLAALALGMAVIASVLVAGAAWRLSQGPVDLAWLTRRLENAVNTGGGPVRLAIGSTALAWEGFRLGVDRPLDLRLTDIRLTTNGVRQVDIPRAEVSLSISALLLGRVQPRALELDHASFTLLRSAGGAVSIDLGNPPPPAHAPSPPAPASPASGAPTGAPLSALLAQLARPPASDTTSGPGWSRQLLRLRIEDAVVTVIDRALGATWHAPRADITLVRQPQGGIDGSIAIALALGDQHAQLDGTATLSPDATATHVVARLSPVAPAALAGALPRLGFLRAMNAPVATELEADLGPALELRRARVALHAGPGIVNVGEGSVPIIDATLTASGTPDAIHLDAARVQLLPRSDITPPTITVSGSARRREGQIDADLAIDLDQVDFADLPTFWPAGVARGARAWILQNITAGTASDGHVSLGLSANADGGDLTITRASGTLQGSGLTVAWLRPVPPIVQGHATLHILDPDTLRIDLGAGRQSLKGGSLAVTGGSMRISGLMRHDQIADLRMDVAGGLPQVITLLREPRLQLLATHPMALDQPQGDVTATVTARVPLDAAVRMDDIALRVAAHVEHAALAGLLAGRDLSNGTLDVAADNNGLTVKGQAALAGTQATLDAAMDFRAGPPSQVVQRISVSGRPDARQLAAAGLDATDLLAGPIGIQAVLTEHRNGSGTVALDADLSDATLTVAPLDWRRALGAGARATAQVTLQRDRLDGIDAITLGGDGVALRGSAQCSDGRIATMRLEHVTLGKSDFAATVSFPAAPRAGPIAVRLAGPALDLSAKLAEPPAGRHPPRPEPPPGPPWTLDARFDHVLTAHGSALAPVQVQAENDGRVFQRLRVEGDTRADTPFAVIIAPDAGHRRLTVSAAQAGDLLRALDVTDTVDGGSLTISGSYDDAAPYHPLRGTIELADFRVAHAVVLGKLLQAMTLYGVLDVLRGPGLSFARLEAPFTLSDGLLTLTDARAFSPSLGLTAKGQIDLDGNTLDMEGTIVPAYFFNALLGNVPLVGRLFSPERGGGLFAASYTIHGNLADPSVGVNPLTALTPGFLRGLFRLF